MGTLAVGDGSPKRPDIRDRLHAAARRWPPAYRGGHHAALVGVPLLLLSGIALYLPRWHAPLIPFFPFIYWGHVVLGLGFAALLLLPVFFPLASRHLAGLDWAIVLVAGGGLTITGILMWLVGTFPAAWRGNAFSTHGLLSIVLGAWVAWHGYVRLRRLAVPRPREAGGEAPPRPAGPSERRVIERREFLRWAAGGLGAAFAATLVGGPVYRIWQEIGRGRGPALGTPGTGASAAARPRLGWPGFQLYTVVPGYPAIPKDEWTLTVDGLVASPARWTFAEFLDLPQTSETETFQCVTGWAVPNCRWRGVRLSDVLAVVRPQEGARYITLYSADGAYTESLSLEQAALEDVLLAHSLNGEDLPVAQGAPVRLVVPRMYGYKSIKWVTRIEVKAERDMGFWEVRGYEVDAWLPNAQTQEGGRT